MRTITTAYICDLPGCNNIHTRSNDSYAQSLPYDEGWISFTHDPEPNNSEASIKQLHFCCMDHAAQYVSREPSATVEDDEGEETTDPVLLRDIAAEARERADREMSKSGPPGWPNIHGEHGAGVLYESIVKINLDDTPQRQLMDLVDGVEKLVEELHDRGVSYDEIEGHFEDAIANGREP